MADAERPAEKANPVALSISPQGFVAHSFPNLMQKPTLKSKYVVLSFYLRSNIYLASTNYQILKGVFFRVRGGGEILKIGSIKGLKEWGGVFAKM